MCSPLCRCSATTYLFPSRVSGREPACSFVQPQAQAEASTAAEHPELRAAKVKLIEARAAFYAQQSAYAAMQRDLDVQLAEADLRLKQLEREKLMAEITWMRQATSALGAEQHALPSATFSFASGNESWNAAFAFPGQLEMPRFRSLHFQQRTDRGDLHAPSAAAPAAAGAASVQLIAAGAHSEPHGKHDEICADSFAVQPRHTNESV